MTIFNIVIIVIVAIIIILLITASLRNSLEDFKRLAKTK